MLLLLLLLLLLQVQQWLQILAQLRREHLQPLLDLLLNLLLDLLQHALFPRPLPRLMLLRRLVLHARGRFTFRNVITLPSSVDAHQGALVVTPLGVAIRRTALLLGGSVLPVAAARQGALVVTLLAVGPRRTDLLRGITFLERLHSGMKHPWYSLMLAQIHFI